MALEIVSRLLVSSSGGNGVKADRWSAGRLIGVEEGQWEVIETEGRTEDSSGV